MNENKIWQQIFFPLAFLFVGIAGVVAPYLTQKGVPGDLGDARLNLYLLEHAFLTISGQMSSFLNAPFFYPWVNTIGLSDTHWGTFPIYSFFRWGGAPPEGAFAGWFVIGFFLNFLASYFANRGLGLKPLGASLGAFLFTFSLPVIAQDGHAQLLYRCFIPLGFWGFLHFLKTKDAFWLGCSAVCVAFQFLATFYMGLFLVFLIIAYSFVCFFENYNSSLFLFQRFKTLFFPDPERSTRVWLTYALFGASLAVLLLVAVPYVRTQELYEIKRHYSEIRRMLPRLQSYLMGDRSFLWFSQWGGFLSIPCRNEHQLFLGVGAFFTFLYAVASKSFLRDNLLSKRFAAVVGLFIVGTIVIGGVSLYQGVSWLPGVSAVRAVSRFILVVLFPIGFIVGRLVDEVRGKEFPIFSSTAVLWTIILLITADSVIAVKSTTSYKEWQQRVFRLESKMPKWEKDSILVVASCGSRDFVTEIDAMLFAQSKGIRTMNGYSGANPRGWFPMKTCEDVEKVLDASEAFYHQAFKTASPLQRERLICVGFPETDPGCRSTLFKGVENP